MCNEANQHFFNHKNIKYKNIQFTKVQTSTEYLFYNIKSKLNINILKIYSYKI